MTWTLNQLKKSVSRTYIPGSPGVPASPGRPATPAYYVYDEPVSYTYRYSTLLPQGYDAPIYMNGVQVGGGQGYRYFDGAKYTQVGFTDYGNGKIIYTYQSAEPAPRQGRLVPAQPAIPPTPGVPATPGRLETDYRLGWNSGATAPGPLAPGNAIRWRFSPGSVGAVVGLSDVAQPGDLSYRNMRLAVMASNGAYTILEHGAQESPARTFSEAHTFAIVRSQNGKASVVVNGASLYETSLSGSFVGDSSLYSGGDVIWDASAVGIESLTLNTDLAAASVSSAGATANPTIVLGPGTSRGVVGASSRSMAAVGTVLVDGVLFTSVAAESESSAAAEAYRIRTLGDDTELGGVGAGSTTDAAITAFSEATGGADVQILPLSGAGSSPGVYTGWAGNFPGDACRLSPLAVDAFDEEITPIIGLGDCALVQVSGFGTGATGEISTGSFGQMAAMLGAGGEQDYASADVAMLAPYSFGTDDSLTNVSTAFVGFSFDLSASGREADRSTALMHSRNEFRVSARSGHQAKLPLELALNVSGTGASVGRFMGVIGYA